MLLQAIAADPSSTFSGLTALSGLVAAFIAAATFYMASRAARNRNNAAIHAVDADAYKRGVEIYEATIGTLRTEVTDLRNEIRGLHDEMKQLRLSNVELSHELDSFRRRDRTTK